MPKGLNLTRSKQIEWNAGGGPIRREGYRNAPLAEDGRPYFGRDGKHHRIGKRRSLDAERDRWIDRLMRKQLYADGGRVGDVGSQEWYNTYGQGAEHSFFPDRRLPDAGPLVHDPLPQTPRSSSGGSDGNMMLGLLGAGLTGAQLYRAYRDGAFGGVDASGLSIPGDDPGWQQPELNQPPADLNISPPVGGYGDYGSMIEQGIQGGIQNTHDWISQDLDEYGRNMEMPTLDPDQVPGSMWDTVKNIGGGTLDTLGIMGGIGRGDVKGGVQALTGANRLAGRLGYNIPGMSNLPVVGNLLGMYEGIKSGDPGGIAGAVGSASQAANALGLSSSTGAMGTLGAFGSVAPLVGAGFAVANLANKALSHDSDREQLFVQRSGMTPVRGVGKVASKSGSRAQTYYALPSGKLIHPKDMEHLHRLSQDAHNKGEPYKTKYEETMALYNSDAWHSDRVNEKDLELLQSQGYRLARGGLTQSIGENMMRPRGGLSMARMTPQENSSSYYRYGASPRPQIPGLSQRVSPALQMPQVRRAMGGGTNFGYNRGGDPDLVRGPGSGRSDDIPARLSDGEYIWDAETVALLGDGSTDEGARRLDALRKKLRMHKGKALSKGQFSAAAKNPEDYLE